MHKKDGWCKQCSPFSDCSSRSQIGLSENLGTLGYQTHNLERKYKLKSNACRAPISDVIKVMSFTAMERNVIILKTSISDCKVPIPKSVSQRLKHNFDHHLKQFLQWQILYSQTADKQNLMTIVVWFSRIVRKIQKLRICCNHCSRKQSIVHITEPPHDRTNKMNVRPAKTQISPKASAQQTRVFAVCYPLSAQRRLWSDWVVAPSLCQFYHEAAQLIVTNFPGLFATTTYWGSTSHLRLFSAW